MQQEPCCGGYRSQLQHWGSTLIIDLLVLFILSFSLRSVGANWPSDPLSGAVRSDLASQEHGSCRSLFWVFHWYPIICVVTWILGLIPGTGAALSHSVRIFLALWALFVWLFQTYHAELTSCSDLNTFAVVLFFFMFFGITVLMTCLCCCTAFWGTIFSGVAVGAAVTAAAVHKGEQEDTGVKLLAPFPPVVLHKEEKAEEDHKDEKPKDEISNAEAKK